MTVIEPTPLRILQVIPYYYPAGRYGGPIRWVHGLSSTLASRGHQVSVYTTNMNWEGTLDVPIDQPVMMDGVSVSYFPVPALRRLFWSPALDRKLAQHAKDFDVVHLNGIYLWPTFTGARVAERAGIPYVMTPHGMMVGRMIRQKNHLAKAIWINLVEKRSLRNASALQVHAELEGREARALGLDLPDVVCVPVGVSRPVRHCLLANGPFADIPRPYVLFLGRINWTKGLDRLITAWKWVPNVSLVIAGTDEGNYLGTLRALAVQQNVAERVHFVGTADDEQKWALYENAELFVLPSYSDSFGIVVAEAMIMSCPVVVTSGVGLADVVRDVGAGIVTDGEPSVLGKAISAFLADPEGLKRAGIAGRRAAEELFSWDAIAARIEAIYRTILRPVPTAQHRRASRQTRYVPR